MLFMTHPWDGCRANRIRAKKQCSLNWKASRLPIRFSKTKRPRNSWTTALSLSSIVRVSSPTCSNPKITVNMARINKYPWTLIIIAIFTFVDVRPTRAASVEERLDQVNRMAEKDRAETVAREARKEGELIWYAAMASDRAGELIKAFESKYPFVKIRFQPGGAGRQLDQQLFELAPRAAGLKPNFYEWIFALESLDQLPGPIARHRRIPNQLAFLACFPL